MRKKKIIPALALALVCFTIGVGAAGTVQDITAQLNSSITIKYGDDVQTLLDADGNRIYPITYNGSTYLPIRAVAELAGLNVDWDQATQTVLLGEQETRTNLLETFKPYTLYQGVAPTVYMDNGAQFVQSQDVDEPVSIGGETISCWLRLFSAKNYPGTDKYAAALISSFNLGGKYNTLTFKAYTDEDIGLTIYGDDNSVLAQYKLVGGQVPQTFTVNLMGTTQLTFQRDVAPDASFAVNTYIFDAYLE